MRQHGGVMTGGAVLASEIAAICNGNPEIIQSAVMGVDQFHDALP